MLRLPRMHLANTFIANPQLAAKFFCLLAMRQCSRLRKLFEQVTIASLLSPSLSFSDLL